MKWFFPVLIIVLLSLVGWFLFSLTPEDCQCDGISIGICIGKTVCDETTDCIPLTCENKAALLGEPTLLSNPDIYTALIIDISKSMEGNNIQATKRASENFATQIGENEYLAVIEFNEQAKILSEFTNDKVRLYNSIDLIAPLGRTRYLEPFTLANELFETVPTTAKKYVLFLSDGAPEDEEDEFIEQVNLLKEKNVEIYALAFEGKSNEQLMQQIASRQSNLFLVTTADDIEKEFETIFTTILEQNEIFLQQSTTQTIYRNNEQISMELFSQNNNANLLSQEEYCPLTVTSYVEAQRGTTFSRILGSITPEGIRFPLKDLPAGTYTFTTHTSIKLDECELKSTQEFTNIRIVEEEACNIDCTSITQALRGGENFTYESTREPISWIFMIDTSSSMNSHLEKARRDITYLVERMPVEDRLFVGTFDNKVTVLKEFGQPTKQIPIDTIVPSASTFVSVALDSVVKMQQPNTHLVIFSDGEYGEQDTIKVNQSLSRYLGCLSTIHYGTHLLLENESIYHLLKNRTCGTHHITQPTTEELDNIIQSNRTTTPQLKILLQQQTINNKSTYFVQAISSFTGKTPIASNNDCNISPRIITTITEENGNNREVTGSSFVTKINESFVVKAGFDNSDCSYTTVKEVQFQESKKDSILTIVSIVVLVLAINMLAFIVVLYYRIKKLTKK